MKKIFMVIFVCLLCVSLAVPCIATEFENPPIVDGAEYLNSAQFAELSEQLERVRQRYDFDVAIVTEYEMTSYDAMSSADDIYDYQGYGAGVNDDGILLYICASTREYHITTYAEGERIFNVNGIEYLKSNIQPHLANDDYYLAMDTYISIAEELLQMAEDGAVFNENETETSDVLMVVGGAALIPLLVAFIMMKGKLSHMKTAVQNDYAANYVKPGTKQLTQSRDMFIYSSVTKTPRAKSNSESHRSSSGRSHGGGGGSF